MPLSRGATLAQEAMETLVLVAHASKHCATDEITERIAQALTLTGQQLRFDPFSRRVLWAARTVSSSAVPPGNGSSILTMETRVAMTDDQSRSRFRRYWLLAGPFGSLIRRMTFRLGAAELRRSAPGRTKEGEFGWSNP